MNNRESGKIHYGKVIILCMCLMMGVNVGLVMSSAGIFYHPVSTDLGVSVGKLGIYMSFNFLSSTLMLSIAGRLMDRFSARMLLTLCSAVLGLTVAAMGLFNAVWQFYIAGCIIGVTLAFLLYLAFPTMVNRWFKSRVGLYIGICSAALGIGGILFNPMGGYLITHYGWRTTYIIFGGIILLLVTPLLGVLLRNYPEDKGLQPYGREKQQQAAVSNSGIEYSSTIKMPVFYGLIVFAFLMICTHEGSGMGRSESDIRKLCPDAKVLKALPIRGGGVQGAENDIVKWLRILGEIE